MLMRKCPSCAEYIHLEHRAELQYCWNCGALTDFSSYRTVEEKILSVAVSPLKRRINDLHERCKSPQQGLVFCSASPLNRGSKVMMIVAAAVIFFVLSAGFPSHHLDVLLQTNTVSLDFGFHASR
jgi:hypothetical protein